MSTELATITESPTSGGWWNDAARFALMQRAAKVFTASSLVPKAYQGPDGIASCIIAMDMAERIGASPLLVMQNLYVVHGNPGWSSQFLIACFNQTGRFQPIRYEFFGKEGTDKWGCVAVSKDLTTGEEIKGPKITIDTAKKEGWYSKSGSKWQTVPELMLRYRAAAWLVRTVAPEIAMGLQTAEEVRDVAEPATQPSVPAIEGKSRTDVLKDKLAAPEPAVDATLDPTEDLLESILRRIADADNMDELESLNAESQTLDPEGKAKATAALNEKAMDLPKVESE